MSTSYKTIDKVLNCFISSYSYNPQIVSKITIKTGINQSIVEAIIEKLVRENYLIKHVGIFTDSHNDKSATYIYNITFEGILLIEDGGYYSKTLKDKSISILNWVLTLSITIGTVLAGIYALCQMI